MTETELITQRLHNAVNTHLLLLVCTDALPVHEMLRDSLTRATATAQRHGLYHHEVKRHLRSALQRASHAEAAFAAMNARIRLTDTDDMLDFADGTSESFRAAVALLHKAVTEAAAHYATADTQAPRIDLIADTATCYCLTEVMRYEFRDIEDNVVSTHARNFRRALGLGFTHALDRDTLAASTRRLAALFDHKGIAADLLRLTYALRQRGTLDLITTDKAVGQAVLRIAQAIADGQRPRADRFFRLIQRANPESRQVRTDQLADEARKAAKC